MTELVERLREVGSVRLRAMPHDDPHHYMAVYSRLSREDGALMIKAASALAALTRERDEAREERDTKARLLDMATGRLAEYNRDRAAAEARATAAETKLDEAWGRIEKLQAALIFWMPSVSEEIERELDGRAGDDAYLLAGFMGKLPEQSWGDKVLTRAEAAESRATAAEEEVKRLQKERDYSVRWAWKARATAAERALDEIAESDDTDNALDPERNKRIARAARSSLQDQKPLPPIEPGDET